ncbi:MAG: uncharacterized protein K0S27_534 [Gammaproteobacteria bacterium]|jgi:hypothetical protein|nr:uncharacterized protein [Gammaproteobacteria bacterium]
MKREEISCGKYQHYKSGKLYEVIGLARHSETHEEMIIYKALYQCNQFGNNSIWVRSKEMFIEEIIYNGYPVQRFKRIDE